MNDKRLSIARRATRDIPDGAYVNLGIGIPTLVADVLPPEKEIVLHSENGILGFGPRPAEGQEDPDIVNAGKSPVTLLPGASIFHHTDSFMMIRGAHLDLALLGALEVSGSGDLANWTTGDALAAKGVGGAMDLAVGAKAVWVLMEHTTRDGKPRIRRQCQYPLTAIGCVKRIYTDLAVIEVIDGKLVVQELMPGASWQQLQDATEAPLQRSAGLAALR